MGFRTLVRSLNFQLIRTPLEQLTHGHSAFGMPEIRSNFIQWKQHKPPLSQGGMRDLQVGCSNNLVAIEKNVDVDRSGLPSRTPDTPQGCFNSEQRLEQQRWLQFRIEGDSLV